MGIDFKAITMNLGDGVATVAVAGEADLFTAPELKEALSTAVDGGATNVLVDLSEATFIDSTTLGVLIGAVRKLRPHGGTVAIVCRDPNISRSSRSRGSTRSSRSSTARATPSRTCATRNAGSRPRADR